MSFEFQPASPEELQARGVVPPVPAPVAPAAAEPARKTARKTARPDKT